MYKAQRAFMVEVLAQMVDNLAQAYLYASMIQRAANGLSEIEVERWRKSMHAVKVQLRLAVEVLRDAHGADLLGVSDMSSVLEAFPATAEPPPVTRSTAQPDQR